MGTFSSFYSALVSEMRLSTALSNALIGSGIDPAPHVVMRRYQCTSKDGPKDHRLLLAEGPMIYAIPGGRDAKPRSEDHGRAEAWVECTVHSLLDNSDPDSLVDHLEFVEALVDEVMKEADGTGGSPSWTYQFGGNVRITQEMPSQLGIAEVMTKLRVKITLFPVQ